MRTEIRDFCSSLSQSLKPFQETVDKALPEIHRASEPFDLGDLLNGLKNDREEMIKIIEQIENEEAYLLIFGPLKSGKSTLMNAISGAYVSEVSSLPAYPCLVYVRHTDAPQYSLSRYDGTTTSYPDNSSLQQVIRDAHTDLARAIKETEDRGESFDPETHFKQAIRQVDIGLTTTELDQGAAVLVDTPGLYAKMKFGYDRMTREFRDRAACAIFVVKADNLYLEPVFDEFNELLSNFSRIFLVVNTDHSKKDLEPDGRLRPSLESTDPDRVIETFRSLAVNTTIRHAFEEGRLQVYPIDLLHSAQKVLSKNPLPPEESDGGPGHERFQTLNNDLEEYLNGSGYVQEFKADTFRRVDRMQIGLENHLGPKAVDQFRILKKTVEDRVQAANDKVSSVDILREIDWNASFAEALAEHEQVLKSDSDRYLKRLTSRVTDVIDAWFESDESLLQLEKDRLEPLLERETSAMMDESRQRMRALLSEPNAGAKFSPDEISALLSLKIDLNQRLLSEMEAAESPGGTPPPAVKIPPAEIPATRAFLDYLLLRTRKRVRKALFGNLETPSKPLPPEQKEKRLGSEARQFLTDYLKDHLITTIVDHPRKEGLAYLKSFVGRFQSMLEDLLDDHREAALEELEAARRAQRQHQIIERNCTRLRTDFESLRKKLDSIRSEFTPVSPDEEIPSEESPSNQDPDPVEEPETDESSTEEEDQTQKS
ncbi:MAG: dynamin family protein [Puniceicoccales bacterium]